MCIRNNLLCVESRNKGINKINSSQKSGMAKKQSLLFRKGEVKSRCRRHWQWEAEGIEGVEQNSEILYLEMGTKFKSITAWQGAVTPCPSSTPLMAKYRLVTKTVRWIQQALLSMINNAGIAISLASWTKFSHTERGPLCERPGSHPFFGLWAGKS